MNTMLQRQSRGKCGQESGQFALPRHRRGTFASRSADLLLDKTAQDSLLSRLWQYQFERFPLHKHGLLVAAFSFAGMSLSSSLRGQVALPDLGAFLVCFMTTLSTFLMLRIADEHKDKEDDAMFRPYLPVPRGLVSLKELRCAFVACALLQVVFNAFFCPALLLVLSGTWSYLFLMSKEFFAREWLRKKPAAYLLSHMVILPLVDAYITACDWLPAGRPAPAGLVLFLALSFFNGIVLELGRKIRSRGEEETGVETYSALWGLKQSIFLWSAAVAVAAVLTVLTAAASGTLVLVSVLTFVMLIVLRRVADSVVKGTLPRVGGRMETVSASWLLVLYICLGLTPFLKLG
ncbi:MAG: UbiA family prenyltransferase [Candidatus Obscuribacterales bacterium]|nr:UbiA family prenyltransferase [Candidatus Obscuribacterales bacterium]